MQILKEAGLPTLYIDQKIFTAKWRDPPVSSVVLASDNDPKILNFIAAPIQFQIFDEIIKKTISQKISSGNIKNIHSLETISGATLILNYMNIEGTQYSQEFNFCLRQHNFPSLNYSNEVLDQIIYNASIIAKQDKPC